MKPTPLPLNYSNALKAPTKSQPTKNSISSSNPETSKKNDRAAHASAKAQAKISGKFEVLALQQHAEYDKISVRCTSIAGGNACYQYCAALPLGAAHQGFHAA